ncbi:hypothetical protein GCM10010306_051580 [Streptomyces umbrinus]|nr:hypothetical protein GCM10010306_051580 [Streptomyces umbrinus]
MARIVVGQSADASGAPDVVKGPGMAACVSDTSGGRRLDPVRLGAGAEPLALSLDKNPRCPGHKHDHGDAGDHHKDHPYPRSSGARAGTNREPSAPTLHPPHRMEFGHTLNPADAACPDH